MRAILNCVNQDSSSTSGIQCDVVSSSTPSSSRQTTLNDDDQYQRLKLDANRRLSIPSSLLVPRDSVAPIASQSSSSVQQPTASLRWSPSPAPPPPGRLVAVTAAAKLAVSGPDARTRSSGGVSHPSIHQHQQQQQQISCNQNNHPLVCLNNHSGNAARVIRGRAASRRTRPVTLADGNDVDCVPQSMGEPFPSVGDVGKALIGWGRTASGSELTEVISSDTASTSDSEDSTVWTHNFSSVEQHRRQSRDQPCEPSRDLIGVSHLHDHCNESNLVESQFFDTVDGHRAKVQAGPPRESSTRRRVEKSERPPSPINTSTRLSTESRDIDGQSSATNTAELSGTTQLTTSDVRDIGIIIVAGVCEDLYLLCFASCLA